MRTENPPVIKLSDYTAPAFAFQQVDLGFDLDPDATVVTSEIDIRRTDGGNQPLTLVGEDLELLSIAIDGEELGSNEYAVDSETLTINNFPDKGRLTVRTRIAPSANTKLEGLYISNGIFCTQCEAEGFRRITYFLDRPDVMTTYRVAMRADRSRFPVLLSNGNLVSRKALDDGRDEAVWEDPFPKPSYLFALVAGDLADVHDTFTTMSGKKVDLHIYVEKGNEDRCDYAMDSLKRSMKWDEERFGLEYDLGIFNIVAISDFNMGAMENKSLNVFNAKYVLANPETATDTDFVNIESIVAHEYFHNWTGNRVTCRDWFQLSLKEGLTVFRDQEFSADQRSRAVRRIEDVRRLRAQQFPEDAGPLAHPVRPESYIEINNFYTATVYEKGAEVIRMMHSLLGEDGFRKGMDLYFERHDGQAVTCDDFVAAMQDAGGKDLSQFKRWYSQAGTPEITVEGWFDAKAKTYTLTIDQKTKPTPGQETKLPLHIPFAVGLLSRDGSSINLQADGVGLGTTALVELKNARTKITFTNIDSEPVPSLNRAFSAPAVVRFDYSDTDLAFLYGNDPDPFARWEAGQQFASRTILRMVDEIRNGAQPAPPEPLIEAIGSVLSDRKIDPAFKALAITLPSEEFVAEQMPVIDVEAIHRARNAVRIAVAGRFRDQFTAIVTSAKDEEVFAPTAEQAAERALKNAALAYIGTLGDDEAINLAKYRYNAADNMTDRMAALSVLSQIECDERKQALDDFYSRWSKDEHVIDKWFIVQATSTLPSTLENVKALLSNPSFSMRKPNKVRALIGAFASANPLRFNAADGSGYSFVAERLIELDRLNPQVAARMLHAFGHWRRFDQKRRDLQRTTLEQIVETEGLSKDCFEIASRTLGR